MMSHLSLFILATILFSTLISAVQDPCKDGLKFFINDGLIKSLFSSDFYNDNFYHLAEMNGRAEEIIKLKREGANELLILNFQQNFVVHLVSSLGEIDDDLLKLEQIAESKLLLNLISDFIAKLNLEIGHFTALQGEDFLKSDHASLLQIRRMRAETLISKINRKIVSNAVINNMQVIPEGLQQGDLRFIEAESLIKRFIYYPSTNKDSVERARKAYMSAAFSYDQALRNLKYAPDDLLYNYIENHMVKAVVLSRYKLTDYLLLDKVSREERFIKILEKLIFNLWAERKISIQVHGQKYLNSKIGKLELISIERCDILIEQLKKVKNNRLEVRPKQKTVPKRTFDEINSNANLLFKNASTNLETTGNDLYSQAYVEYVQALTLLDKMEDFTSEQKLDLENKILQSGIYSLQGDRDLIRRARSFNKTNVKKILLALLEEIVKKIELENNHLHPSSSSSEKISALSLQKMLTENILSSIENNQRSRGNVATSVEKTSKKLDDVLAMIKKGHAQIIESSKEFARVEMLNMQSPSRIEVEKAIISGNYNVVLDNAIKKKNGIAVNLKLAEDLLNKLKQSSNELQNLRARIDSRNKSFFSSLFDELAGFKPEYLSNHLDISQSREIAELKLQLSLDNLTFQFKDNGIELTQRYLINNNPDLISYYTQKELSVIQFENVLSIIKHLKIQDNREKILAKTVAISDTPGQTVAKKPRFAPKLDKASEIINKKLVDLNNNKEEFLRHFEWTSVAGASEEAKDKEAKVISKYRNGLNEILIKLKIVRDEAYIHFIAAEDLAVNDNSKKNILLRRNAESVMFEASKSLANIYLRLNLENDFVRELYFSGMNRDGIKVYLRTQIENILSRPRNALVEEMLTTYKSALRHLRNE
jgi:hypothetical protein